MDYPTFKCGSFKFCSNLQLLRVTGIYVINANIAISIE